MCCLSCPMPTMAAVVAALRGAGAPGPLQERGALTSLSYVSQHCSRCIKLSLNAHGLRVGLDTRA